MIGPRAVLPCFLQIAWHRRLNLAEIDRQMLVAVGASYAARVGAVHAVSAAVPVPSLTKLVHREPTVPPFPIREDILHVNHRGRLEIRSISIRLRFYRLAEWRAGDTECREPACTRTPNY